MGVLQGSIVSDIIYLPRRNVNIWEALEHTGVVQQLGTEYHIQMFEFHLYSCAQVLAGLPAEHTHSLSSPSRCLEALSSQEGVPRNQTFLEHRFELDPQGVFREKNSQSLQCWPPCCRIQPWRRLSGSLCYMNPAVRTDRSQQSWTRATQKEENRGTMQELVLSLKGTRPRKSPALCYGRDITAEVKPTDPQNPWCIL